MKFERPLGTRSVGIYLRTLSEALPDSFGLDADEWGDLTCYLIGVQEEERDNLAEWISDGACRYALLVSALGEIASRSDLSGKACAALRKCAGAILSVDADGVSMVHLFRIKDDRAMWREWIRLESACGLLVDPDIADYAEGREVR